MEHEGSGGQPPAETNTPGGDPLAGKRAAFGEKLKGARQSRGLSAAALAQVTRIGAPFIAALEEGAFEKLPGEVFGRGYVRCICKNLSVDSTDFIAEFDSLWEKVAPRSVLKVELKSRPVKERNDALVSLVANAGSLLRSGIVWKLGLPAVAGVAVLYALIATPLVSSLAHRMRGTTAATSVTAAKELNVDGSTPPALVTTTAASAPTTSTTHAQAAARAAANAAPASNTAAPAAKTDAPATTQAAAAAVPAAPLVASAAPEKPAAPADTAAKAVEGTPGGKQVLELVVTEPMRVKIEVDHGKTVVKELTPDSYKFSFNQTAEMMVYDAAAVTISYNGRPLGALGGKGRIRRLSFQAEGPTDKKL